MKVGFFRAVCRNSPVRRFIESRGEKLILGFVSARTGEGFLTLDVVPANIFFCSEIRDAALQGLNGLLTKLRVQEINWAIERIFMQERRKIFPFLIMNLT